MIATSMSMVDSSMRKKMRLCVSENGLAEYIDGDAVFQVLPRSEVLKVMRLITGLKSYVLDNTSIDL